MTLKIVKGNLENYVREEDYEKTYKDKGWKVVSNNQENCETEIKHIKTESDLKNYLTMAAAKPLQFNDNLFYSEGHGVRDV